MDCQVLLWLRIHLQSQVGQRFLHNLLPVLRGARRTNLGMLSLLANKNSLVPEQGQAIVVLLYPPLNVGAVCHSP